MRFPPHVLDDIRKRIPISEVVGRRVTWDKRKSNPGRGDYWAPCPAHGERTPSFHADNRRQQMHCFGCGFHGDIFTFMVEIEGYSFVDAVAELAHMAGVALPEVRSTETAEEKAAREARAAQRQRENERERQRQESRREQTEKSIRECAWEIWNDGKPIGQTLAERYLRARGLEFDVVFPSLRYIAKLPYPVKGTPIERCPVFPVLLAAVRGGPDLRFRGIWRIYMEASGEEKLRVIRHGLDDTETSAKLGLARTTGGGVWLQAREKDGALRKIAAPIGLIEVGEGLESSLGVYGLMRGTTHVVASLSTSGMRNFVPPESADPIRIWPDMDTDKLRLVERKGGGQEKKMIRSPGIGAGEDLIARLEAEGRSSMMQTTVPDGADYLDLYRRLRRHVPA